MLSLARAERNNMDKAQETQTLVNKLQEELQRSEHLLHVHKRDEEAKMNALKSKFFNENAEMHRQLEEKVEQMRILQSNLEQSTGKINEYKSVINALEIRLTSVTNVILFLLALFLFKKYKFRTSSSIDSNMKLKTEA